MRPPQYTVLYYPEFDPSDAWLRRHLLLCDQVVRIIPRAALHNDPPHIRRLRAAIPGAISEISPTRDDVSPSQIQVKRLNRAFKILSQLDGGSELANADAARSFPSFMELHSAKLTRTSRHLLTMYRLAEPTIRRLGLESRYQGVRREAGHLIMAVIADRVALREGLDTITTHEVAMTINTLNAMGIERPPSPGSAEGDLLSAVVKFLVPYRVSRLSFEQYLTLRDRYAGIRPLFQQLSAEWSQTYRLDRTSDWEARQRKIISLASDLQEAVEEFQAGISKGLFRKWSSFTIGALLAVPTSLFTPTAATALKAGSTAFSFIDRFVRSENLDDVRSQTVRLLSAMRQDTFKPDIPGCYL